MDMFAKANATFIKSVTEENGNVTLFDEDDYPLIVFHDRDEFGRFSAWISEQYNKMGVAQIQ